MSKAAMYSRNLAASWGMRAASLLVMFFLTPFIIYGLGDVRYGIWSLVLSVSGWIAMADIGLRHGISKFLNEYLALGDERRANQLVMTSMVLILAMGLVAIIAAVIIGGLFDKIFTSLPREHFVETWIAMGIVGVNFAVALQSSLSRRILEAFNRFDLTNLILVIGLLIRSGGVVLVLTCGGGLIELALVTLGTFLLEAIAMRLAASRVWPGLKARREYVSRSEASHLIRLGVPLFFSNVSGMLISYTDFLIVGILIGVGRVTVYSIGYMLISHARQFLRQISRVLTPDLFKRAGAKDHAALRHLFLRSVNVTALACIPLFVGLLFFGEEFISLWMKRESGESALVLSILTIASFSMMAGSTAGVIIVGLGRARLSAGLAMIEAAVNLTLSLAFVMVLGWDLPGVAMGTLVSALAVGGMVRPIVACRMIRMSVPRFAMKTYAVWALAGTCFAAECFLVRLYGPAGSWGALGSKVAILAVLFLPIGWYVLLPADMRDKLRRKLFRSRACDQTRQMRHEVMETPAPQSSEGRQP